MWTNDKAARIAAAIQAAAKRLPGVQRAHLAEENLDGAMVPVGAELVFADAVAKAAEALMAGKDAAIAVNGRIYGISVPKAVDAALYRPAPRRNGPPRGTSTKPSAKPATKPAGGGR